MKTIDVSIVNTVDEWLDMAIASIDQRFGKGFAKANPELLGAFLQTCAGTAQADAARDGWDAIDSTIDARLRDITNVLNTVE